MVHCISRWRMPRAIPGALGRAITGALLAAALTAHAQPTARATRPDPLDPKAGVPTLTYESSFSQYRRLGEPKPIPWREANDAVARIGGWRAYAREAQQPEPASVAKPSEPVGRSETAKPQPHGDGGQKAP